MRLFRSRFPGSSPYSRPGFPCHLSGSVYSAVCQFPFILPCFAPTAASQVLAWLRIPFGFLHFSISPFFPLPFVRFFPGSITRPSVSSFPAYLFPLTVVPQVSFRFLSSASRYSAFPAFPFSAPLLRTTGATSAAGLLFPARPFPLAFALGSGYLARVCTLKTEH